MFLRIYYLCTKRNFKMKQFIAVLLTVMYSASLDVWAASASKGDGDAGSTATGLVGSTEYHAQERDAIAAFAAPAPQETIEDLRGLLSSGQVRLDRHLTERRVAERWVAERRVALAASHMSCDEFFGYCDLLRGVITRALPSFSAVGNVDAVQACIKYIRTSDRLEDEEKQRLIASAFQRALVGVGHEAPQPFHNRYVETWEFLYGIGSQDRALALTSCNAREILMSAVQMNKIVAVDWICKNMSGILDVSHVELVLRNGALGTRPEALRVLLLLDGALAPRVYTIKAAFENACRGFSGSWNLATIKGFYLDKLSGLFPDFDQMLRSSPAYDCYGEIRAFLAERDALKAAE